MSNLIQRAITGGLFVLVLVLCIVFGGIYFHLLFALIGIISLNEFYQLFNKSQIKPNLTIGLIGGTLIYFFSTWILISDIWDVYFKALLVLIFPILAFAELYRKKKTPFENIGVTFIGWVYIMLPLIILNHMMWSEDTNGWTNFLPVLSIFILVWTSDTFAYLFGRKLGKHKLFERISPNKSWEGFVGGAVFAGIAGLLIAYFYDVDYKVYLILGLLVACFGTIGDLIESMLKRSLKVKDSGNILPGHGGILDRIDAVLFVIPIVYFMLDILLES